MLVSRHSVTKLLIAFLMLPGVRPLIAADWPQWRGPNRDGTWTDAGIVSSFPSTGLALKSISWLKTRTFASAFSVSMPVQGNGSG
jgi:hypothetical protein